MLAWIGLILLVVGFVMLGIGQQSTKFSKDRKAALTFFGFLILMVGTIALLVVVMITTLS